MKFPTKRLEEAIARSDWKEMEAAISAGADLSLSSYWALRAVILKGNVEATKLILQHVPKGIELNDEFLNEVVAPSSKLPEELWLMLLEYEIPKPAQIDGLIKRAIQNTKAIAEATIDYAIKHDVKGKHPLELYKALITGNVEKTLETLNDYSGKNEVWMCAIQSDNVDLFEITKSSHLEQAKFEINKAQTEEELMHACMAALDRGKFGDPSMGRLPFLGCGFGFGGELEGGPEVDSLRADQLSCGAFLGKPAVLTHLLETVKDPYVIRNAALSAAGNSQFETCKILFEKVPMDADLAELALAANKEVAGLAMQYVNDKTPGLSREQMFSALLSAGHTDLIPPIRTHESDMVLGLAACQGNIEIMDRAFNAGARGVGDYGMNRVIQSGNVAGVKYLFEKGYDIYRIEATTTRELAYRGKYDMLKFLLESGVKPHEEMLERAIDNRRLNVVELALEHGVPVTKECLKSAVEAGQTETVETLLNHKLPEDADITKMVSNAIRSKSDKMIELVLSKGGDIKADKHSALHWAKTMKPDYLPKLLSQYSNKDIKNALTNAHVECVVILQTELNNRLGKKPEAPEMA